MYKSLMAHKLINAAVLDATFAEQFIPEPDGERFLGYVSVALRDLDDDTVYVKQLTEEDLSDITGVQRSFSPLELIRIAEYIRQFPGPISLVVSDNSHIVTNKMVQAEAATDLNAKSSNPVAAPKPSKPAKSSGKRANFGPNSQQANRAMAKKRRNPPSSA